VKHNTATTSIMSDLGLDLETQPTTADLTPMLDTIFLIILLLLATLMNSSIVRGFPVNLPAFSEETAIQKENNSIEISVDKDGSVYVGKMLLRKRYCYELTIQQPMAESHKYCVTFPIVYQIKRLFWLRRKVTRKLSNLIIPRRW